MEPTRTSIQGRPHCGQRVSSADRAVPQYTQRGRWVEVAIGDEDTDRLRESKHFDRIISREWFEVDPADVWKPSGRSVRPWSSIVSDVRPRTRRQGSHSPDGRDRPLVPLSAAATGSATRKRLPTRLSGRESTVSAGSVSASTADVALGAVAPYPQRSELVHHPVVTEARNIRASQIRPDV